MLPTSTTSLCDVDIFFYPSCQRICAPYYAPKDTDVFKESFYVSNDLIYENNDIICDIKGQGYVIKVGFKGHYHARTTSHASANIYAIKTTIYAIKPNISYVSNNNYAKHDVNYVIKDHFYALLSIISALKANLYAFNDNIYVINANQSSIKTLHYVFTCMMCVLMPLFYVINELSYAFKENFYVNKELIYVSVESDYENKEKTLRARDGKGFTRILKDLCKGVRVDSGLGMAIYT